MNEIHELGAVFATASACTRLTAEIRLTRYARLTAAVGPASSISAAAAARTVTGFSGASGVVLCRPAFLVVTASDDQGGRQTDRRQKLPYAHGAFHHVPPFGVGR